VSAGLPGLRASTPRVVLACGGLRRELERLAVPPGVELRYLDPELHRSPRRTRVAIQGELHGLAPAVEQVALAWGLCGGAVLGLWAEHAWLVIPRVHDCIGLHLEEGRSRPGGEICPSGVQSQPLEGPSGEVCTSEVHSGPLGAEVGTFCLTPGWLASRRDPLGIFEHDWVPRVGREEAARTLRRQFARYTQVALVGAGLDDDLRERAARNARLLGLPLVELPGSDRSLWRLLNGDWDPERFVLVPPGQPVPRAPFLSGPGASGPRG
jgi:hypothetical protein